MTLGEAVRGDSMGYGLTLVRRDLIMRNGFYKFDVA